MSKPTCIGSFQQVYPCRLPNYILISTYHIHCSTSPFPLAAELTDSSAASYSVVIKGGRSGTTISYHLVKTELPVNISPFTTLNPSVSYRYHSEIVSQPISNMTTLPSTAAKRRAARRSRHARSRARRLAQPNAKPSSATHAPKRRKLRDQESLDLEDCFFQCEEQGYHLDPDVRIGREVAQSGMPCAFLTPLYPFL